MDGREGSMSKQYTNASMEHKQGVSNEMFAARMGSVRSVRSAKGLRKGEDVLMAYGKEYWSGMREADE